MQADQGETNDGCIFLCVPISLYPAVLWQEGQGSKPQFKGKKTYSAIILSKTYKVLNWLC